MKTSLIARNAVLSILGVAAFAAAGPAGQSSTAPAVDALFVRMEIPQKVMADEVFPVTITMKNTGTADWAQGVCLYDCNSGGKKLWGTDYIILGQGRLIRSGQEAAFRSYLRAPPAPGKHAFQWRAGKRGKPFGEPTEKRIVLVTARPAEAEPTRTEPTTRPAGSKRVLAMSDFEYVGSFKPPAIVKPARAAFSEVGMTLLPPAGGARRMLLNYTHPGQVLFEIEIPALVDATRHPHTKLAEAAVGKVWGGVRVGRKGDQAVSPNGGICWDQAAGRLYWTSYHGYWTGPSWPLLGATRLGGDGGMTHLGPWRVSSRLFKGFWGGVTTLPKDFAAKHTRGRRLALGFGGYYSICAAASRGPALGAIPEPDPAQPKLDVLEMLLHPDKHPAERDGDYFTTTGSWWGSQPTSRRKGDWAMNDFCAAGAFVDTPDAHAYIAFASLATGRIGYDYGAITSAGRSQCWFTDDPADLARVAAGQAKPWAARPARVKIRYPLGHGVTDTAYDPAEKRLYIVTRNAYSRGREQYPVVHVYRVARPGRGGPVPGDP